MECRTLVHRLILFFSMLLILPAAMAAKTVTVLGLKAAQHYRANPQQQRSYIIQVASFKKQANARSYQNKLASQTKYTVYTQAVGTKRPMFVVYIGPIPSVTELQRTGRQLAGNSHHASKAVDYRSLPMVADKNKVAAKHAPAPLITRMSNRNIMTTWGEVMTPGKPQYSDEISGCDINCDRKWFVGLDVGFAWSDADEQVSINNGSGLPAPLDQDIYSLSKASAEPFFSLKGGYRWETVQPQIPYYSLALQYRHFFRKNLNGDVTQFSLPAFNNYTYGTQVSSEVVSLVGKVNVLPWRMAMPYLMGSVGYAYNKTRSYHERAKPGVTPRVSPAFGNKTNNELAYSLGLGIDLMLSKFWTISIGYEYQDLGEVGLANGQGTWSNASLGLGDAHTNLGVLSMTYQLR